MSKVGKRYARALFDSSSPAGLESISNLLDKLSVPLTNNSDLRNILSNPSIPLKERVACLDGLAEVVIGKAQIALGEEDKGTVMNFLSVVFEANRLSAVTEIASEFKKLVVALKQHVSIEIESALPLTVDQLSAIEVGLGQKYKNLATTTIKDMPELLSGVRIKIGDTIVDSSVRGRLDSIRSKLLAS